MDIMTTAESGNTGDAISDPAKHPGAAAIPHQRDASPSATDPRGRAPHLGGVGDPEMDIIGRPTTRHAGDHRPRLFTDLATRISGGENHLICETPAGR
jgi:hypothetical protein